MGAGLTQNGAGRPSSLRIASLCPAQLSSTPNPVRTETEGPGLWLGTPPLRTLPGGLSLLSPPLPRALRPPGPRLLASAPRLDRSLLSSPPPAGAEKHGSFPSPPPRRCPPPPAAAAASPQGAFPGRLGVTSRRQAICRNRLRAPEIPSGPGVLAGAPSCPLACVPYLRLSRACPAGSVPRSPCRHPPPSPLLAS